MSIPPRSLPRQSFLVEAHVFGEWDYELQLPDGKGPYAGAFEGWPLDAAQLTKASEGLCEHARSRGLYQQPVDTETDQVGPTQAEWHE